MPHRKKTLRSTPVAVAMPTDRVSASVTILSPDEGLTKAAAFLNQIIIKEGTTAAWWV